MLRKSSMASMPRQTIVDYRCIVCLARCQAEPALCEPCQSILPWWDPTVCLRCGSAGGVPCEACTAASDPFNQRFSLFEYAFPVDALLKRLKYQETRAIGRTFGLLLGQAVQTAGLGGSVDILLPVPLSRSRRRHRGFNQAADIATTCGYVLAIPSSDRLLERRGQTPMLAGLSPVERRFALLGAFAANPEVAGRRIALIDDVMTSGATAMEINRELRDRGAKAVSIWTVARTGLVDQ